MPLPFRRHRLQQSIQLQPGREQREAQDAAEVRRADFLGVGKVLNCDIVAAVQERRPVVRDAPQKGCT